MGKTDPKFKVGDGVSGIYHHPTHGTVHDPSAVVVSVNNREDGKQDVTVQFRDDAGGPDGPVRTYVVSETGRSDYVIKTVDFTPHEK